MSVDVAHFQNRPWLAGSAAVLRPTRHVPTMLTGQEQRLYYWLTHEQVAGPGAIVDLGCFIGGSTARLAQGLADGGRGGVIHAYDRFTVDAETRRRFLADPALPPIPGTDILPAARELLAPWADVIRLIPGEIHHIGWDAAHGPIALLILDACKRTEWTDQMAQDFYPDLIAGQSIVNHQDFGQWHHFWVAAHMALMADFFEPLVYVPGGSMLFRCIRVPDRAQLRERRVADLDDAQMIAALRQARRWLRGFGVGQIIETMIRTVEQNPGQRFFWELKNPHDIAT
ncbi:hypothetical protein [Paracoccus sp. (in: a-proteobacteria)]|uniref:hypothetical protein n=1 Tax=Paracoccus sp. TaxID=267 RepID=UPI0026E0A913|nr:hypothetical protein [Paracoccus sp. (in: a-proteobacteria)]MDO5648469.1 hypothetical protein [Paracoccus sp. (in: a-proteobacteria)]